MKKIFEQEEEAPSFSREKVEYDIVLSPVEASVTDLISAFENIDNYGKYISNIRNTAANLQQAIDAHFGPNIPAKRKALEKQRGTPFPVKTKTAIDDFIKSYTNKPKLLKYTVKDDTLVFPRSSNPNKEVTKNIIKTVLDNAGINYKIKETEAVSETKSLKLMDILNEVSPAQLPFVLTDKLVEAGVIKDEYINNNKPFASLYGIVTKITNELGL